MNALSLTTELKAKALGLGFDLVGATPAVSLPDVDCLKSWLADGCAGEMRFFSERFDAYRDLNKVLPDVKSILMLGLNYRTTEPKIAEIGQGKVSRYAWGDDYHDVIRCRLQSLAEFHTELKPKANVRGVVDTAPILERSYARQAGLGWIGKNNLLINKQFGSWLYLAALLTTEELEYDRPYDENLCGNCRKCLDACPTGALTSANKLDARLCMSYLTIEYKGRIPTDLAKACGNRLFGCDTCQDVCPWNRNTTISREKAFLPRDGMNPVQLSELFQLDEALFRKRFKDTPLWRAKLSGILRNATMIMESTKDH